MSGQPKNTGLRPNHPGGGSGFSYWETKGWLQDLDAVVVGGGLVGMSAALRLRERHSDWRILIVDRATVGGATTRNAGFACFGSPSELLEDWHQLGAEDAVALVHMRWEGLQALRQAWGDEALGYRECGAVEAFCDPARFEACREALPMLNEALKDTLGQVPFHPNVSGAEFGLNHLAGVIASPLEGAIDTSCLATVMRQQLHHDHIGLLTGHEVTNLKRGQGCWTVETTEGDIQAPHVLVANNGWASALLDLDVQTAPNTVLVSQPLPDLHLPSTVHHDRGYVYAREVDGRVLIGGGRHWACPSEAERVERLKAWAVEHMAGVSNFEVEFQWRGHLGVGASRGPLIKDLGDGLFAGVRMGGMGVAIGTRVGRKLADLM